MEFIFSFQRFRTILLACLIALAFSACTRSPEVRSARFIEAGKNLLQKNDPARAELQFRNAVQAMPRNAEAHYQLGLALLAAGDPVKAVSSFHTALQLQPKHRGAQLKLAQLLASVNDPDAWKDAQKRLQALLEDSSEDPTALHALALTELKLGDNKNAVLHLQRAMALAPQELLLALTLAQTKLLGNDVKGAEEILKKASDDSPKSADAMVILGRFYASQNNLAKAEEQFKRALGVEPKNVAALLNLATLQAQTGHKQEAETYFKRLTEVPYTPVRTYYGVFLFQEGRRDEAIRELQRVFQQDPDDRIARTRLIAAYQATGRVADAEKLLAAALKKNPRDLEALLQRGELSIRAGKLGDAELDLNRVVHLKPDSPETHYALARLHAARGATLLHRQELNEVLRLNPQMLPVRVELAKSLLADKAAKAAMGVLDGAPESQKSLVPIVEQRNWALIGTGDYAQALTGVAHGLGMARTTDLLLQDALLKIAAKHYPEARRSLQEALANAPADVRLLRAMVGSYAAQNQVRTGVEEVRAHAAKNPKSAQIQYFFGNLLLETGDQAQAKQAFASAKTVDPKYIPADIELARMNLKQANWTDARQQLTTILSADADNPLPHLWMGMLETSVGNHGAAIAQFRKVTDAQPTNAIAWNNLAYLLAENGGQMDEALKYAQKAQELAPDNPDIQDTLGWVLYHKGLYPNAITQLQAAVSKGGGVRQQYHLAMAYLKAGQESRGREVLNAALRKDSKPREAKQAQELFQTVAAAKQTP